MLLLENIFVAISFHVHYMYITLKTLLILLFNLKFGLKGNDYLSKIIYSHILITILKKTINIDKIISVL